MPFIYHENQIPLDSGLVLWRYFDFDKFESFLKNGALFFCRADKFSDPFEGSLPRIEADYRLKDAERQDAFFQRPFDEAVAQRNIAGISSLHQRFKRATVVNCWHINQNESDAMWRLYLKDNEGVAIQTTSDKMLAVIDVCDENLECSKVRYINYDTDSWYDAVDYPHTSYNIIIPLIHKRREYEHESEFRLYQTLEDAVNDEGYWQRQPIEKGKLISVDLNMLVESVIFAPTSDSASQQRIKDLCHRYGHAFCYRQSALNDQPIY